MSTEFHVFTYKEPNHEQAVVFEVNRCLDDTVELLDVYIVSTSKMGEVRTKLNFQNIINSIMQTKGGNVDDENVSEIIDVFSNLISDEHKKEIETEIEERKTDIHQMNAEQLIMASELIAGLDPETYPEMIENLRNNQAS